MSQSDDYLKDLQDFEYRQGIAKLRTLLVEFDPTLERLPNLRQELEKIHKSWQANY